MQNAQNTEIQQRVIDLVELYRTKVGKESDIAKAAKADYDFWEEVNLKEAEEDFANGETFSVYTCGEGPHTEVWIKGLKVNEQLLGHFYAEVTGENAEKEILDQLLPEVYDKSVFTEEEENFLKSHFREMVNYIIQTPNNDLTWVNRSENKDVLVIPDEVLELIKSRVEITAGSTIYYPHVGFAQLANLFKECKFLCNAKNAWSRVALFANKVNVEIVENCENSSSYDAAVSYLPVMPKDEKTVEDLSRIYENINDGGLFILLCPSELLVDKVHVNFWKMLIGNNAIQEIIQLPSVMTEDVSLVIARKGMGKRLATLIDARFAGKDSSRKDVPEILDMEVFRAMIHNGGKEVNTGLRKMIQVSVSELNANLLVPQIYVVEKPAANEGAVPLSELCSIATTRISSLTFDLPEDTPWVEVSNLSQIYRGAIDLTTIRKAECPNIPSAERSPKDYAFDASGNFIDEWFWQIKTPKGLRVHEYRRCTYIDGKKDAVLFRMGYEVVGVALIRATGKPVAIDAGIKVFVPNYDFDALSLVALFQMPIVYRQIQAYKEFGLENYLDDILVPTDKRVICDEISRMKREEVVTTNLRNNYIAGQEKLKEKQGNYQHAMRKHIREISSSVRRMERFINDMDSSEEVKKFLNDRLAVIKTHRLYLSEDIERLNEENTYGEASPFDIDHSLRNYREYFGYDVCPVKYTNEIANEAIRQYQKEHQDELKELDEQGRDKKMEVALAESSLAYVDIAEYNFGKIVRNILENAKKHGFDDFTDVNHKDCVIEIALNWDKERQMYRIDFRNNGNPLPEGLTKESYGENRKYAGKTGGTGIGGYEVAENVRHYNGDFAISQDGDWTVVSIYLPKSKIYGERL